MKLGLLRGGAEGQELESALNALKIAEALPDTLPKPEMLMVAEAAADEAAVALKAAIAEQQEGLGREVLTELADQLGATAPNVDDCRPGELGRIPIGWWYGQRGDRPGL